MAKSTLALLLASCLSIATAGSLWPKPQSASFGSQTLSIDARAFTFVVTGASSGILQDAIDRFSRIVFVTTPPVTPINTTLKPIVASLPSLWINVLSSNESLTLTTSENYTLVVDVAGNALLTASTVFGALRGLETFSQLVDWVPGSTTSFLIPECTITNFPRFPHRGALMDTSRHFIPVSVIYAYLDAMAQNFLNVFHWHIVDDQSFPYYSSAFPNLSTMGSWNAPDATHVYSKQDVADVIEYALQRGIRTLIEFDTPGHTTSWGKGQPGLLTQCYNTAKQPIAGDFGPIDPTKNETWTFLQSFFSEVAATFPDQAIFIGGDEVSFDCWKSNPDINAWMAAKGWMDYAQLENYYVQRLIDLIDGLGKTVIGWQELFDNNLTLPAETVVVAWKGGAAAGPDEMHKITAGGHKALLSAGWYENYIAYGSQWSSYYNLDPQNFTGTEAQKSLVMGGELACWGEYVDSTNAISRVFPYGAAIAERLWSDKSVRSVPDATLRIHEQRCRMLARGIPAEPANGPSFCPVEFVPAYNPPWKMN